VNEGVMMRKNSIYFIILFLIVLVAGVIWYIPRTSAINTVESSTIDGPVYQGEYGAFDQFYVNYKFNNPGITDVEITELESTILLNGSEYNSQEVTHDLAVIDSGSEREIVRVVQLTLSPIGLREGQVWNITLITEVTAESQFLLYRYEKTVTDVKSIEWEVHLFE
jgi:hypothetical protein